MKRLMTRHCVPIFIFTLAVFLLLSLLPLVSGCGREKEEEGSAPSPAADYYSMIRSCDKLVLSEMAINKMGTVEDLRLDDAKGGRQKWDAIKNIFKIGTRKGAYSYNTYLQAYMNLDELTREDVEIDSVNMIMKIRLPSIRTELAGRDVEVREEHYRVSGLRSNITAQERARVKEAMNEMLKKEVDERSEFHKELLVSARSKAESYFQAFAAENGYTAEITIK